MRRRRGRRLVLEVRPVLEVRLVRLRGRGLGAVIRRRGWTRNRAPPSLARGRHARLLVLERRRRRRRRLARQRSSRLAR